MKRGLKLEFFYPHSPEAVWRALTDPEALRSWLMENDFQPVKGHRFEFRMPPKPGFDGIIRCEVTEVEPLRRLSYSWSGGWGSASTVVTWTLEAAPGGTRLLLSHDGFEGLGGFLLSKMMAAGWRKKLSKVVPDLLAKAAPAVPPSPSPATT